MECRVSYLLRAFLRSSLGKKAALPHRVGHPLLRDYSANVSRRLRPGAALPWRRLGTADDGLPHTDRQMTRRRAMLLSTSEAEGPTWPNFTKRWTASNLVR